MLLRVKSESGAEGICRLREGWLGHGVVGGGFSETRLGLAEVEPEKGVLAIALEARPGGVDRLLITLFLEGDAGLFAEVFGGKPGQGRHDHPQTDGGQGELEIAVGLVLRFGLAGHDDAGVGQGAEDESQQHGIGRNVQIKINGGVNDVDGHATERADVQGQRVALHAKRIAGRSVTQ